MSPFRTDLLLGNANTLGGLALALAISSTLALSASDRALTTASHGSDLHFKITPPTELSRLANEWEPQQALILSVSYPEAMEDLEIARNFVSVLDAAHPYLDIHVFGDQEKHAQYAHFLSLIQHHPRIEAILEKTRFVDSRSLLRWARDFGPIFGFDTSNRPIAIDMVFRDEMKALEEDALQLDEPLDPLRDFFNLHGDAMPAEVVATLQAEYETPIEIVRPPVSMDGGDFVSDSRGNIFISRQTLVRNGGQYSELQDVFRRYFGAQRLHILEALPGRAVPHLDMIVKFLDADTVVLPDFKASPEPEINPYLADLNRSVRSTLEANERYLRNHFPDLEILKAPMPPILFKSKEDIVAEAKQAFVKAVALDKGLATKDEVNRITATQSIELEQRVLSAIQQELPSADFSTPETLDAVLRRYGQLPLDAYIDRYSEPVTRYRSYINSVFLHAKDGRQAFLVPRFTASDSSESAQLAEWENEVEQVYRSAWPEADIHWINCDSMVADLGFLHCASLTVPLLEGN